MNKDIPMIDIDACHSGKPRMKRVFVCSPYAGNITKNTMNAIRFCKIELAQGNAPFASHLLFPQIVSESDPLQRQLRIMAGIEFMKVCDEFHVYGEIISEGMAQEISAWRELGRTPYKCSISIPFKKEKF